MAEFDSDFMKSIELLYSKDPNSEYELFELLQTQMIVKYGHTKYLDKLKEKPVKKLEGEVRVFESIQEDLECTKCGNLRVSYGNQLMECSKCHLIYHQLCHVPVVKVVQNEWICSKCDRTKRKQSKKESQPIAGHSSISKPRHASVKPRQAKDPNQPRAKRNKIRKTPKRSKHSIKYTRNLKKFTQQTKFAKKGNLRKRIQQLGLKCTTKTVQTTELRVAISDSVIKPPPSEFLGLVLGSDCRKSRSLCLLKDFPGIQIGPFGKKSGGKKK